MKPIKIVHLITGLNVGGAETMLFKLVSRMDRRRFHSVVVSLINDGPVGEKIRGMGVPVYSLGMRRGVPSASSASTLARLFAIERPDVLQTWMYHANVLGLMVGRATRVRHIVWNIRCSNLALQDFSPLTVFTIRLSALLSRLPSAAIVNSEAGRADHDALGFRPLRWIVLPNGFDLDQYAPRLNAREEVRSDLGIPPRTPLVGFIGRYHPMKGHALFMEAANSVLSRHPDLHFLLAGRNVLPANEALISSMSNPSASEAVHLLGERADIPRLMAALDIAVSPSIYGEGFPNVIGEAMACAVPCVVSDVGDSALVVGRTGIVVPARSPEALASGIDRLLRAGEETRRALGQAARARVQTHFSIDRIVGEYAALYASFMEA
jgi:glycosyltransferase involved in cell wall biosynthesis